MILPRMPFLCLAVGALYAAPGAAHAADASWIAPGHTLLTLSAEGQSTRPPDVAIISAGVSSTGQTATGAMAANAQAMNRVIAALKAAGIEARDMQTSNLTLSPSFANRRPDDDTPPRITGYTASNQVAVRDHDLPHLGQVIDALTSAGANQIDGPSFGVDKPDMALDEARAAAIATARARAELYAHAAGLHVARIITISESAGFQPRPMMLRASYAVAATVAPPPPPVEAGEVALNVTVNVEFELAP